MYNKFFGFKEKPFKLVPDPEYLFLSRSHEEALAHLSYAINHGDGFVEIIGEVGTGKTTLCRVFLENLDETIEAAYIFNPKLDALQLLKAINDEFGLDSGPDNTKDLIDRLNRFLIDRKSRGRKVLVLIDEAQNLSLEVLEQLRLLSNLETTREKLLQIILVGQPELAEMLASHQLRQLGQRITINCRLTPLTLEETGDYIRHRIALASHRAGPPFDRAALRAIYEYSRGIPRLINIACDRALLNAFSRNSFRITAAVAREAISELKPPGTDAAPRRLQAPAYLAGALLLLVLASAWFYLAATNDGGHSTAGSNLETARPGAEPVAGIAASTAGPDAVPSTGSEIDALTIPEEAEPGGESAAGRENINGLTPVTRTSQDHAFITDDIAGPDATAARFLQFLKNLNSRHSRNNAILQAVKLWEPDASVSEPKTKIESDQVFFREATAENRLLAQPLAAADLSLVETLNLPAVLTFYLPNHAWPKYLTLAGLDAKNGYLAGDAPGEMITVDRDVLGRFWSGEAYVVWKNFIDLDGIITAGSRTEAVKSLKRLLRNLAYPGDPDNTGYDAALQRFIKDIQRKYGLEEDGIVGPFTKIALYNESDAFIKPSLGNFKDAGTENGS